MTTPTLAGTGAAGHRVYRWQGREFPSVTAILNGGVPKPFLSRWAAKAAAEYAISHLDHLRLLSPGQAIREVKQAPWATRDASADLGDLIHAAVEAHATGHPRPPLPPHAEPYLVGFDRFLADHQPVFLAAEQTVYSCRYGYAGTFDALATLPDHGLTLLDVKTGNRIYPEVCLQLAAYAAADFIGQPDTTTEQPLPTIQAGAVLHLRPGGYQLLPVPIGWAVLEAFLAALAVFRFTTDLAPPSSPRPTRKGGELHGRPARHAGRRPAGVRRRPGLGLGPGAARHPDRTGPRPALTTPPTATSHVPSPRPNQETANMDTHVTIAGNLTDHPELRFTPTGDQVCNLRVAVTARAPDGHGGWRDGTTSFFRVTVWRAQAEHAAESLTKGARVLVCGRLRQRSWETDDGERRQMVEIEADELAASLKFHTATLTKATRAGRSDVGDDTEPVEASP